MTGLLLQEVSIRLICWFGGSVTTRAIRATSSSRVIGGGPQVATSMVYAVITDGFPKDQRYVVSHWLRKLSDGNGLTRFLKHLHLFRLGCGDSTCLLAALALPESRPSSKINAVPSCQGSNDDDEVSSISTDENEGVGNDENLHTSSSPEESGSEQSGCGERKVRLAVLALFRVGQPEKGLLRKVITVSVIDHHSSPRSAGQQRSTRPLQFVDQSWLLRSIIWPSTDCEPEGRISSSVELVWGNDNGYRKGTPFASNAAILHRRFS
nr:hypothetical protein CFP56_21286 [Quercus suber]